MSEGACAADEDHELVFNFDAAAIDSGSLALGLNIVVAEPSASGLVIRYRRPTPLVPNGVFGSCDGVVGTLDFVGELDTDVGTKLKGRFDLMLPSCDASDAAEQSVTGTFDTEIRRSLSDACPGQ